MAYNFVAQIQEQILTQLTTFLVRFAVWSSKTQSKSCFATYVGNKIKQTRCEPSNKFIQLGQEFLLLPFPKKSCSLTLAITIGALRMQN